MKYSLWRSHKARPADYESVDMGARVEVDTEVDTEFEGMTTLRVGRLLSKELDDLLDVEVTRALELGGEMDHSHLVDYYPEK